MVWFAIGALSLAVIGLLAWPVFARSRRAESVGREAGGIDETDYLAAQAAAENDGEARRRLLAASRAKAKTTDPLSAPPSAATRLRGAGILLIGAVPIAAVSVYLVLGRPDYQDTDQTPASISGAPDADAGAAEAIAQMPAGERLAMIENMVDGLSARLAEKPDDLEGWQMLARSNTALGRYDDGVKALETALENFPDNEALRLAYAQSLFARRNRAGEPIDAQTTNAFEAVLAINSDQPLALFVLGEAASLSGKKPEAARYWKRLLAIMPPDAPETAQLADMIEALD